MNGTLYVVATPIGNLEDITLRAVRILGEVSGIAAEDTRHTRKLLNHLGIKKPLLSLHAHNEAERVELLTQRLARGEDWALVSDAGTPGISDPGAVIVAALRKHAIACVPVPGPSALAAALSVGGLSDGRFFFEGFLPASGAGRRAHLAHIGSLCVPILLYESPHRLAKTLGDLLLALGDRPITIFRELTKLYEEVRETSLIVAAEKAKEETPRGEHVLLIHANEVMREVDDDTIAAHILSLLEKGIAHKEAVVETAKDLGVRKNRVYRLFLDMNR